MHLEVLPVNAVFCRNTNDDLNPLVSSRIERCARIIVSSPSSRAPFARNLVMCCPSLKEIEDLFYHLELLSWI
ncbi:MAG: hypothetical protein LM573_02420 [Thermofilum sp.]|nr:hypothetical protein [Thermofilum sp.]